MTAPTNTGETGATAREPVPGPHRRAMVSEIVARAGLIRFSGLYGLGIVILVFSLQEPELFVSKINLTLILVNSAVAGILALGVLVPLSAGLLDLSFASVAGFSLVAMCWASVRTSTNSFLVAAAIIAVCALFGLVSGLLVAYFNLDSLIVTLGMSSIVLGLTQYLTQGNTLTGRFDSAFQRVGLNTIGVVPLLTIILLIFAIALYIWLEHTPGGRFVLATGSNINAARLSGVNVRRIQITTLTFSALISGIAGVLLVSRVGSATDTIGQGYLLPVVAGLFLGTTQVYTRPNVWGTMIAIYLLGTGIQGIQLEGNEPWVSSLFDGVVLLVAITVGVFRRRTSRRAALEPAGGNLQPVPEQRAEGGTAS